MDVKIKISDNNIPYTIVEKKVGNGFNDYKPYASFKEQNILLLVN